MVIKIFALKKTIIITNENISIVSDKITFLIQGQSYNNFYF